MRILDIYHDYHVSYATEGHKHCREGWVNTPCPFCSGTGGYHLGYNVSNDYYNCWRCGPKWADSVLSRLLGISLSAAEKVIEEYGGKTIKSIKKKESKVNLKPFQFPSGNLELLKIHRRYLEKRGFDPDRLIRDWNITGTGPASFIDKSNYSKRILIPIFWNGEMVSFQGRTITNQDPKYKACPQEREIIEHQTILYGNQSKWTKRGILVEGVTDVWKLGPKSAGTFGIDFTRAQTRQIRKHFEEVVILFDPERQAQIQAKKLIKQLEGFGVPCIIEKLDSDPGDLSQEEADYVMKNLLKGIK